MEQEYSKNMIYGNFRSMENQAFPIDCETLSALQNNIQKIAAIAKIAGCNLILSGCKISGTRRTEGYVYVDNGLTGEILYHPDQQKSDYCHIEEQNETVTADGTEFSDAYTTRYLSEGVGGEPIKWSTFTDVATISNTAINTALTTYKQSNDTALQNEITERENADTAEKTARENADKTMLSNAKVYTDTKVNAEASARQTGDTDTLDNAKAYTDSVFGAMNVETDNYGSYVHAFKQGKIVYLDIHGLPLNNCKEGKNIIYINLYSHFYPKNGYAGVGFHTDGDLSGFNNGNNLLPFSISEYGRLVVVNPGNVSVIWASACYLSKE